MKSWAATELTVFPGIELQSELGGQESVHLIGIFSELRDVDEIWTKVQGQLNLTPQDVAAKGDESVYVRFEVAANLIHELDGIVSVPRQAESQIRSKISAIPFRYKAAFKSDLARKCVDLFEMGQARDATAYKEIVFPSISQEKPLIICSDNHNVLEYRRKANCWIKADPAFRISRQITTDPSDRVFVGEIPPRARTGTPEHDKVHGIAYVRKGSGFAPQ